MPLLTSVKVKVILRAVRGIAHAALGSVCSEVSKKRFALIEVVAMQSTRSLRDFNTFLSFKKTIGESTKEARKKMRPLFIFLAGKVHCWRSSR